MLHELYVFKFMIMFASCIAMVKAHNRELSQNAVNSIITSSYVGPMGMP
jgi:hypothetical protein